MSALATLPLDRARTELRAARSLLRADLPSQALTHAYFASYHAASAALLELDETPSTHAGVIAAFDRRIVGPEGIQHNLGRVLRRLFEHRSEVDYALAEIPKEEAVLALAESERLVTAINRWIRRRDSELAKNEGSQGPLETSVG
jgi:uncharacterized protein (UPF0332 family)